MERFIKGGGGRNSVVLMAFLPAFTHSPNKSLHQVTRTGTANSKPKPDPTEHRLNVHLATLHYDCI